MKFQKALNFGKTVLQSQTRTLDTELLLEKACGLGKEYIYAHPEKKLSLLGKLKFLYYLHQATRNKPIAYITGHKEFFGLDFKVNRHVLIPRPDTEILVEEALKSLTANSLLVEIGTGSACISCAISKHKATVHILACDISKAALRVAQKNVKRLGLTKNIKLQQVDLIPPELAQADLIIANLPYIRSQDYQNLPAGIKNFEPKLALEAGPDGLKYYRRLLEQLPRYHGVILIEIADLAQAQELENLFPQFEYERLRDLSGSIRALKITKKP